MVMDHTDSSGIISQILKQTIVQAGIEVAEIRNRHTSWTKNTETRMSRLLRSADDAERAQIELKKLQAQLDDFGGSQNDKSKKVMMGVAGKNDKLLVTVVFSSWFTLQQKLKSEKGIRDMFEAEIEALDTKLMEYRQAALNNVRNVLMRKAAEGDSALLQQVWKAWTDEVQETKREAGSQGAMAAMEAKLASQTAAQAENNKKVMARMAGGSDNALLTVILGAWVQFSADYKKNKEEEDEIEELLAENEARFGALNGRQKDNAMGVQKRVNEQMDLNLMLKHFSAWATDTKLERIMRHYNSKMEGKKHQLQSVQHLFKSFANQLDQGLKGEDSARDSSSRRRKDDGLSLPDINAKR